MVVFISSMYQYGDIDVSEEQIREGKTKDSRKALSVMKEKYDL